MYYYSSIAVNVMPGKRLQAIDHLKKLAQHWHDTYGVETEVMGNVTGKVYRNAVVTRFDTLAQYEQMMAAMVNDDGFLAWFQGAEGLFDWNPAETSLFQVFE